MPVGLRPVTVAVKVTFCPTPDGLSEEDTVVDVFAMLTLSEMAADALPVKFASPL